MSSQTVYFCLQAALQQLEKAGVVSAGLDASLLLAHTAGIARADLLFNPDKALNNKVILEFNAAVARRAQHEPVAYIIGVKEFWSLDFSVTRDTLIPRPDSETLIEAALKRVRSKKSRDQAKPIALLDIGTGTGCLLIALMKELPAAGGIGLDNSERALQVAEKNAKRHGVDHRARFIQSHWCDALQGTFDLILSNPPYIAESAMSALMPDVLHYEPRTALAAGADGLDAYRMLAPQVAARLNEGGYVLFEVGEGQAEDVAKLLDAEGLITEAPKKDLAGIVRCVIAHKGGFIAARS